MREEKSDFVERELQNFNSQIKIRALPEVVSSIASGSNTESGVNRRILGRTSIIRGQLSHRIYKRAGSRLLHCFRSFYAGMVDVWSFRTPMDSIRWIHIHIHTSYTFKYGKIVFIKVSKNLSLSCLYY